MDAQQLAKVFVKHCFRSVLAVNEFVTLANDGAVLAFRVTAAHTLDAAAREVSACFSRLLVMPVMLKQVQALMLQALPA